LLAHWRQLPAPDSPLLVVPHIQTWHAHLARAGIAPVDERGRHADFHSLRYTFCTWMSRRHPIEVVQRLMRHCTIRLTADLYADLGLEDIGRTVWALPPLLEGTAPPQGPGGPGGGGDQGGAPAGEDAAGGQGQGRPGTPGEGGGERAA